MAGLTPNTRLDILLDDIIAYIDHLRASCDLDVTIHQVEWFVNAGVHRLFPYNLHRNPLCVLVKGGGAPWSHCIHRQNRVLEKAQEGPFFGMCWAGVSEFVFPVYDMEGKAIAFISISGYACERTKALQRIASLSEAYGLDSAEMIHAFDHGLRHEIPDMAAVRTLIQPLSHQLTLMSSIFREIRRDDKGSDSFYNSLLHYLNENYMHDISLEHLAVRFNCSVSQLSHMFHRYHHGRIRDYINALRVSSAKIHLLNTQMSIQSIAYSLGYSDSNYFSTVFRKHTGMSPRAWREKQRQNP